MRLSYLLFTCTCTCAVTSTVFAEPVFPIDPQQYGTQKPFGPPKPITPQNVLTARPENQFDLSNREDYPNVVNSINDRMDKKFHLTIGQYGDSTYTGALWRQREANYYLIGSLAYTNANSYEDGAGSDVNYGYDRKDAALVVGFLPTLNTEHRLTLVYDDINDDKQPQHVMDPVNTRRIIGKYNGRFGAQDDSNTVHVELSAIDLERNANNFDLRTSPMNVYMDVERQKYAADIHYNYRFNDQHRSSVGIRFEDDSHDAKRYLRTANGDVWNGYRFPDIHTQNTRLYASHEWQPSEQHSLKGALSYDWQTADVRGANDSLDIATLPSPNQLWQAYYGKQIDGDIKNDGLSGKLRYTFTPSDNQTFYGEAASLYRMPENTEQFAILPGTAGSGWAENPWLKPERENRLTVGMTLSGDGWGGYQSTLQDDYASAWQFSGEAYYADVDDFITLDRYHGSNAALQNNVISDNVDAKIAGVDVSIKKNWTQNLSSSLGASYRYGQNDSDDRPLYQVAPFEANLSVDWKDYFDGGSYNVGARLRYQDAQNRLDDDILTGLGIDNATDSFTALDVYAGVEWKNTYGVSFGIDNVFDKEYAEFITGNHVESVSPSVVNAPGRTFWLRMTAAF